MAMTLKEIVEKRLSQLHLGAVEAAVAAKIERTYIRDIVEGKKKSVRIDKLGALASALKLDPAALQRNELVPADETSDSPIASIRVPLLATVSAGAMMRDDVSDEAIGSVEMAGLKKGDWLALTVVGDSMDRISPPDSLIFVDRSDRHLVANACYVIDDGEGNATYKRYRPNPMRFEPVSTNPAHQPIFPDNEPTIIGRVGLSMIRM
jgi:phage repressor protein C with HTH and peptisase S24 domain